MFGRKKKVIVEEVVPPLPSSAGLLKGFVPSAADGGPVAFLALALAFLLYVAVLLLRAPRKSPAAAKEAPKDEEAAADGAVAEEEVAEEDAAREVVVTEEESAQADKDIGRAESMTAASSASSSGDSYSVSDQDQEADGGDAIEDDQSVEETYDEFLIKAAKSDDSGFATFEREVFAADGGVPQDGDVLMSPKEADESPKEADAAIEQPSEEAPKEATSEAAAEPAAAPLEEEAASPEDVLVIPPADSEDEVSALGSEQPPPSEASETETRKASAPAPAPPAPKTKEEEAEDARWLEEAMAAGEKPKPRAEQPKARATVNVPVQPQPAQQQPRRPSAARAKSMRKNSSNTSLRNLRRNLSFNKLGSVKKMMK